MPERPTFQSWPLGFFFCTAFRWFFAKTTLDRTQTSSHPLRKADCDNMGKHGALLGYDLKQ
jgi:hypothetical protein